MLFHLTSIARMVVRAGFKGEFPHMQRLPAGFIGIEDHFDTGRGANIGAGPAAYTDI